jgi:hypothetical protein
MRATASYFQLSTATTLIGFYRSTVLVPVPHILNVQSISVVPAARSELRA